jgi:hypothetical protein
MQCDQIGDCQACAQCAAENECPAQYDACVNDMECVALIQCFEDCNNQPDQCYEQCAMMYPAGYQLYYELVDCAVCQSCPQSCGGC